MIQKKISVIHSYPIWLPQTQTWMYNQVKYLPKSVEVHIVCEIMENLDQFSLPNIHCLRDVSWLKHKIEKTLRNFSIRSSTGFLKSVATKIHNEIVHSHFGNIGWQNLKIIKRIRNKHLVTFYGYDVNMLPMQNKIWIKRYCELFNEANYFLCEGPFMGSKLVNLGCPKEKIIIHHLGVEVEKIPYKPRIWKIDEPLNVLIVASFVEKKGIPYALEALAQINKQLPIKITIIGDVNPSLKNNSEKLRIINILEDNGLIKNTRLLGFLSYQKIFEEAYKHHIFISPSITASDGNTEGGAPVTIIEMMATGMPVVSTTHCDIPEVVRYGVDGWLVSERDVNGLIKKIDWLIENPKSWGQMLDLGRKHIETEFDANNQGIKLAKVYRDVLDR